jgi:hypothetical protein
MHQAILAARSDIAIRPKDQAQPESCREGAEERRQVGEDVSE